MKNLTLSFPFADIPDIPKQPTSNDIITRLGWFSCRPLGDDKGRIKQKNATLSQKTKIIAPK